MPLPKCPTCGEQREDGFDVCWDCGTALVPVPNQPDASLTVTEPPAVPKRQFHLRHLFLVTTLVAVICGIAVSTFGPLLGAWLLFVILWMTAGIAVMMLTTVLLYVATGRAFYLWGFFRLVEDEESEQQAAGLPVDVWHARNQLADSKAAEKDNSG